MVCNCIKVVVMVYLAKAVGVQSRRYICVRTFSNGMLRCALTSGVHGDPTSGISQLRVLVSERLAAGCEASFVQVAVENAVMGCERAGALGCAGKSLQFDLRYEISNIKCINGTSAI
jgi:hypothetical protein